MVHKNNYAVIMAGGIGSRFWPMSRTDYPKQFHDVLGTGRSLLRQTWDRLRLVCPAENILVVTNKQYNDLVREQPSAAAHQKLAQVLDRLGRDEDAARERQKAEQFGQQAESTP